MRYHWGQEQVRWGSWGYRCWGRHHRSAWVSRSPVGHQARLYDGGNPPPECTHHSQYVTGGLLVVSFKVRLSYECMHTCRAGKPPNTIQKTGCN
jgi:hypothetical protein